MRLLKAFPGSWQVFVARGLGGNFECVLQQVRSLGGSPTLHGPLSVINQGIPGHPASADFRLRGGSEGFEALGQQDSSSTAHKSRAPGVHSVPAICCLWFLAR